MKAAVFRGSPRKHGNTNSITDLTVRTLEELGWTITDFDLYRMDVRPCLACRECQKDWNIVSCAQRDDMEQIFSACQESDLLVLSTPIYSWYCTPPAKAMLDRLVYAMNMYYGGSRGPSLWEGKTMALITTCGYPPDKGSDLLEEGIRRYCRHSRLNYAGMLCERHMGYEIPFMDDAKAGRARDFARRLSESL